MDGKSVRTISWFSCGAASAIATKLCPEAQPVAKAIFADGRLIAAAPQMAEENERLRTALKSILELDGTNDLPDAWDIANDALQDITAIAKATGETDGK